MSERLLMGTIRSPAWCDRDNLAARLLRLLAIWGILVAVAVSVVHAVAKNVDPDQRAVVAMGMGLIVIWCVLGGMTMHLTRRGFVVWAKRFEIGWRPRFIILCVVMAMLEEAVTTALTNAGPIFGAATSAARITSSSHYFEVISGSVLVFIPWFICWAWLLGRYDFRPLEVMLLFGLTGTLAETITFGFGNLAGVGMWVYVYGLMVYLPVQTVPGDRRVEPVRWYHCVMAVLLPLVFIFPFLILVITSAVKRLCALPRKPTKT